MNPSPPPVPFHCQPYTLALKGNSLLFASHFRSAQNPAKANHESRDAAFVPPTKINNGETTSATDIVVRPQSKPSVSMFPSTKTCDGNEMARLHQVNMELTDKVRQWEAWYMNVRHEFEASHHAHVRAAHLQSQVEELQRQKFVLSARVRRWQSRAKHVHKAAEPSKKTQGHEEKRNETVPGSTLLPCLEDSPKKAEERSKPIESTGLHPRPFKKRRFQPTTQKEVDSPQSASTSDPILKTYKKCPGPIFKVVRIAGEQTSTRCSTPQASIVPTPATPITPSEDAASCSPVQPE